LIVPDFVMLGRTVPEPTSQKVLYVCSAGVSSSQGLLRLYPLTIRDAITRWTHAEIDLVPHAIKPHDSRPESRNPGPLGWRAVGKVRQSERAALLAPFVVGSIAEANARRMSLALVKPLPGWEFQLDRNPGEQAPHHEIWGPLPPKSKERFAFTPRLRFNDSAGPHRIQVRDWGVFELMRKYEGAIAAMGPDEQVSWIGNSLKITDESLLFVGNYASHRTAWCVISVLNGVA
jgi:hypothetical protein